MGIGKRVMSDETLELLIGSYGLTYILNYLDLEPVYVLRLLEEQEEIEINKLEELL
jgi:hypothetical protein